MTKWSYFIAVEMEDPKPLGDSASEDYPSIIPHPVSLGSRLVGLAACCTGA
ncbi:rCG48228 [Rattus norvegicus]|uniref:RCG48228 n=1 Tax=Rattus norvegicus TaxID=10116 RepID=A6HYW9_RAT|nr:rCG48228 [Rattus norvegicus]